MSGAYERFLARAEVDEWSACLDELRRDADAPADAATLALVLAQGLCVAFYLGWLARAAGETVIADRADEHARALRARALGAGTRASAAWRLCRALVLVSDGYPAHARALLGEDGIPAPELAVLLIRGDDVSRLVGLRGFIRGYPPATFLPAVYDYLGSLVNVGGVREARQVLATGHWDENEPLLIELRAAIHERLGQWAAAYAEYRRSTWPEHRYRAAVVGAIAGRGAGTFEVDESIRQVLLRFEGELDQAGTTRSMAFLNACLWRPVESWMLEVEVGRLCFRRRQFAEADVHLSRALLTAPEPARHPIAELRFTNLTWLTGDDHQGALDLLPETLEAGAEAVRLGGPDERTANVRLWIAEKVHDTSLIPGSLDHWTAYDRALAYDALGDPVRLIDSVVEAVETAFNHRAACILLRHLHEAGLLRAVTRLAEVVLLESGTTFFPLWETCAQLQELLPYSEGADSDDSEPLGTATAGDELWRITDRYRERLVELSQFDFMNGIRTCRIAVRAGYGDLAEELLLRAAKQAESVSELVAVAVERRSGLPRSVRSDQEALRCLAKARGIARDRLERLQIAQELFGYGAIRDGRALLEADGALSTVTPLTHSETIALLQCTPWCTDEERRDAVVRAAQRLARDDAAGVLGPYPDRYGFRLISVVTQVAPPMEKEVRTLLTPRLTASPIRPSWTGDLVDQWERDRARLDTLLGPADDDPARVSADAELGSLCTTGSFGLRLLIVKHLRGLLAEQQEEIRGTLPTVPPPRVPVDRWYDNLEGPRVVILCDLWRSRILGDEAADVPGFVDEERQLAEEWEQHRREKSAPALRRVVRTADALGLALTALIDARQRDTAHPILQALFAGLRDDVERLTAEAAEQARAARHQLSRPPAPVAEAAP